MSNVIQFPVKPKPVSPPAQRKCHDGMQQYWDDFFEWIDCDRCNGRGCADDESN